MLFTQRDAAGQLFAAVKKRLVEAALTGETLNNGATNVISGSDITSQTTALSPDTGAYRWVVNGSNYAALSLAFNSGSSQTDFSGGGYTTTLNGNAAYTPSGCKIGGCISLDGNNDYGVISPNTLFSSLSAITISAWTNASVTGQIISNHVSGSAWESVELSHGSFVLNSANDNVTNRQILVFTYPNDNAWHHVVGLWTGTQMYVYLDGSMVAGPLAFSATPWASSNPVYIGARNSASAPPTENEMTGLIDDLQVFRRALSPAEIAQLYADGTAGLGGPTIIKSAETAVNQLWDLTVTPISSAGAVGAAMESSNPVLVVSALPGITGSLDNPDEGSPVIASLSVPSGSIAGYRWVKNGSGFTALQLPFNSGSTQTDVSGNDITVTNTNGVAFTTSNCKVGGCLSFDGVDDYLAVASHANLNATSFTVEAWVRATSFGSGAFVVSKEAALSTNYYLAVNANGTMEFDFFDSAHRFVDSVAACSTGTWCHIVGSYNGSTLRSYVNGSPDATLSYAGTPPTTGQTLRIGARYNGTGFFNGFIDEVKIYPRALSAAEVLQSYQDGLAGVGGPTRISAQDHALGDVWDLVVTEFLSNGSVGNSAFMDSATIASAVSTTLGITTPSGTQAGNITINYSCSDASSLLRDFVVEYSTNGGGSFANATLVSTSSGSLSSPNFISMAACNSGTSNNSFVWNSAANGVGTNSTVQIRITAQYPSGPSATTSNFTVDNGTNLCTAGGEAVGGLTATETSFDNTNVLISGCTYSIDGQHTFNNLFVRSSGVLTHSVTTTSVVYRTQLTVTGQTIIESGSSINVVGRGFTQNRTSDGAGGSTTSGGATLASGGSHGGQGGIASGSSGNVYDSVFQPADPGAGSGNNTSQGGGYVKLTTASLDLSGTINANAAAGAGGASSGAGGGVWITVTGAFTGSGTISANGGTGVVNNSHGFGGGGRVAVYYSSAVSGNPTVTSLSSRLSATGGSTGGGTLYGAAGTVYIEDTSVHTANNGEVIVNNNAIPATVYTLLSGSFGGLSIKNNAIVRTTTISVARDLLLTSSATLTHDFTTTSTVYRLDITVGGLTSIDATSSFNVQGRGFTQSRTSDGAGGVTTTGGAAGAAGGSHGGQGGGSGTRGVVYDSVFQPADPGGGSGNNTSPGGGYVKLTTNDLTVTGTINANADPGAGGSSSGAGGGLWVTVSDALSISGTITANGGNNVINDSHGFGAGGRVAVYYNSAIAGNPTVATLSTKLQAYGGSTGGGTYRGAAGTVYIEDASVHTANNGELYVNNNNAVNSSLFPAYTLLSGTFGGLNMLNRAVVRTATIVINRNLLLTGTSVLTHDLTTNVAVYRLDVTVGGLTSIDATSTFNVQGRGFLQNRTSDGAGGVTTTGGASGASGGSHGGQGGGSGTRGAVYDSVFQPADPGAGSGNNTSAGGGYVKLTTNDLTLAGTINADADPGFGGGSSAAGGGIWVIVSDALSISGTMTANGGNGVINDFHGFGGGGRVAVHYNSSVGGNPSIATLAGQLQAYGGSTGGGSYRGAAGTVYIEDSSVHSANNGDVFVNNNNAVNSTTFPSYTLLTGTFGKLSLQNRANLRATTFTVNRDLLLTNTSSITHDYTTTSTVYRLNITVGGLTSIDATSIIDAYARGFPQNRISDGAGGVTTTGGASGASGGSHGGQGGVASGGTSVYDNFRQPADPGGGSGNTAAAGGGYVKLTTVDLTMAGIISMNGSDGPGGGSSAAGGGIWIITTGAINITGTMRANGGNGVVNNFHGFGAGGRIAFYYNSTVSGNPNDQTLRTRFQAYGGSTGGGTLYGAAGTIYIEDTGTHASGQGTLVVHNNNANAGVRRTPLFVAGQGYTTVTLDDLFITNFGNLLIDTPCLGTPALTVNGITDLSSNGSITNNQSGTCTVTQAPINITTTTLPSGQLGAAYSQTVLSVGGYGPHTFTCRSGGSPVTCTTVLPPGLDMSSAGVISGTPTTAGLYSFTVRATEASPGSGIDEQLLSIAASTPPTAPTNLFSDSTNAQSGSTNPTGIDGTPVFSAVFNDPDAGDTGTKYQIQVASDSGFTSLLWDSGSSGTAMSSCAIGARCQNIAYGGSALTLAQTVYYWRIKFFDSANFSGPYSATAQFTTLAAPSAPTNLFSDSTNAQTGSVNPSGLDTTPVFSAVFNDLDVGDTSAAYRVQVSAVSDFSSLLWDSGAGGTAMAVCNNGARCADIAYGGSGLSLNGTLYYWRIKYFDSTNTEGAFSATATFTTSAAPTAPTDLYVNSSDAQACCTTPSGIDLDPVFSAVFHDPDTGESAAKYRVQVAADTGFTSLLWDSGAAGTNLGTSCGNGSRCENIVYGGSSLSFGTTYYWRIKFWDNLGNVGVFSLAGNFTTSFSPSAPTDLYSDSTTAQGGSTNPTGLDATPVFSAVFQDSDVGDVGTKYRIQVASDIGFTTLLWDSGAAGTSMTSCMIGNRCADIAYAGSALSLGSQTYYWRIKFWDSFNVEGAYSATAFFTTLPVPNAPTLLYANATNAQACCASAMGLDTTPVFSAVFSHATVSETGTKYRIQVASDSGFTTLLWDNGAAGTSMTSCSNGNRCADIAYGGSALSLGAVTYYWRVQYFDSLSNPGPFSTAATFTTSAAPTAPTDLYTDSSNAQSGSSNPGGIDTDPVFSAVFQDPDSGAVADKYRVQVASDTGFTTLLWDSGVAGTAMSNCNNGSRCSDIAFAGSGISIGSNTYYWRIKFWDTIGVEGAFSATALFSTQAVPTTPTLLFVDDVDAQTGSNNPLGITAALPHFSAVFNHQNIGAMANKYRIQVDDDASFGSVLWDSGAAGTTMNTCNQGARCEDAVFGGADLAQNGTKYYWRIKFFDTTSLESPWSEDPTSTNSFTMAAGGTSIQVIQQQQQQQQQDQQTGPVPIPQQPNTRPSAPSALRVEVIDDASLRYVWQDQSNDETGFRLYNDQGALIVAVGAGVTAAVESGLQPNTTYSGRTVVAYNDAGESAPSNVFEAATTAMPALTPVVTQRTANRVTFTVLPAVINLSQGQSGIQYEVIITPSDPSQPQRTVRSDWQSTAEFSVEGVSPQDTVQVRVIARNQVAAPAETTPFVDLGQYGRLFDVTLFIRDKATGQLTRPLSPNSVIAVTMDITSVGAEDATSVVLNLPLPQYVLYRQGTLVVDGTVGSDHAGRQGTTANQNGIGASWALMRPGERHSVSFELAFDTDALARLANGGTAVQASANPLINLQASVSFAESDIVYMSPVITLEPDLTAFVLPEPEPVVEPPVEPQPVIVEEPVQLPTPEETQIIEQILQQEFPNATPTPQTTESGEQPSAPPAPTLQTGETNTSTDGNTFNLDVAGGDTSLALSGNASVVADQIQFVGTTSQPFTVVTLIFNDSITAIVVSDAEGHWQTFVSAERLGIKPGQDASVKIEAIAAKGDLRSERVSVGEVQISRGRSGDITAEFDSVVSESPAVTVIKQVQKEVVRAIEKNEPAIQTTLAVSAPVVVASSVPLWGYLPYAPTMLYHLITYMIGYSGRKKRIAARFYGVAYDSITKQPLALAIIRIYKVEAALAGAASLGAAAAANKKLVTTVVTDKQGRYDALLQPGTYQLEVAKPGYIFPSQIVTTELDADYQHVYSDAAGIKVEGNQMTIPDVPLDPVNAQRQWQLATGIKKIWMLVQKVGNYLATPILVVGAVSSAVVVASVPDKAINWVIAVLYIGLLAMQLKLKPKAQKAWGVVYDIASNAVLPLTALQLIEPASSKVVASRLSDYEGRFTFLPEPGRYIVKASKHGYQQVAEVVEAPQTNRQPLHGEVAVEKPGQTISGDIAMRQTN